MNPFVLTLVAICAQYHVAMAIEPMYRAMGNIRPKGSPAVDAIMDTFVQRCRREFSERYFLNKSAVSVKRGYYGYVVYPILNKDELDPLEFLPANPPRLFTRFAMKIIMEPLYKTIRNGEHAIGFQLNDLMDFWPVNDMSRPNSGDRFRYIGFVRTLDFFVSTPMYTLNMKTKHEYGLHIMQEYVEGTSLRETIGSTMWYVKDGRPSMDFFRVVLLQILSSLWYSYEFGYFTHYDLHVSNIRMRSDHPEYSKHKQWIFDFTLPREDDSEGEDLFREDRYLSDDEYGEEVNVNDVLEWRPREGERRGSWTAHRSGRSGSLGSFSSGSSRLRSSTTGDSRSRSKSSNPIVLDVIDQVLDAAFPNGHTDYGNLPTLFPEDFEDSQHNSLLRFKASRNLTDGKTATIIDFGLSRITDPRTGDSYGDRPFFPIHDLRRLGYDLIKELPVKNLREWFCVSSVNKPHCKDAEERYRYQKEYLDMGKTLQSMFFATTRRSKTALNKNNLFLEVEIAMRTRMNEMIENDLGGIAGMEDPREYIRIVGDDRNNDLIAAASIAFNKDESMAENIYRHLWSDLHPQDMTVVMLKRQVRRTILEILRSEFFYSLRN